MCADWRDLALHGKVLTEATGKFVECIRQNVMDVMAHIAWMDRRTQAHGKIELPAQAANTKLTRRLDFVVAPTELSLQINYNMRHLSMTGKKMAI